MNDLCGGTVESLVPDAAAVSPQIYRMQKMPYSNKAMIQLNTTKGLNGTKLLRIKTCRSLKTL